MKPAHDRGFDSHCLQRRHPPADNGEFKRPNVPSAPPLSPTPAARDALERYIVSKVVVIGIT